MKPREAELETSVEFHRTWRGAQHDVSSQISTVSRRIVGGV